MDDPISSADELETAVATVNQLLQLFRGIHMQCHKLCSNSPELLQQFSEDKISVVKEETEVLGVQWNSARQPQHQDFPVITAKNKELLSKISGIFDPLGFHSPLVSKGKQLMQKVWQMKIDWNEILPQSLQSEVSQWTAACKSSIEVPRYLGKVQKVNKT